MPLGPRPTSSNVRAPPSPRGSAPPARGASPSLLRSSPAASTTSTPRRTAGGAANQVGRPSKDSPPRSAAVRSNSPTASVRMPLPKQTVAGSSPRPTAQPTGRTPSAQRVGSTSTVPAMQQTAARRASPLGSRQNTPRGSSIVAATQQEKLRLQHEQQEDQNRRIIQQLVERPVPDCSVGSYRSSMHNTGRLRDAVRDQKPLLKVSSAKTTPRSASPADINNTIGKSSSPPKLTGRARCASPLSIGKVVPPKGKRMTGPMEPEKEHPTGKRYLEPQESEEHNGMLIYTPGIGHGAEVAPKRSVTRMQAGIDAAEKRACELVPMERPPLKRGQLGTFLDRSKKPPQHNIFPKSEKEGAMIGGGRNASPSPARKAGGIGCHNPGRRGSSGIFKSMAEGVSGTSRDQSPLRAAANSPAAASRLRTTTRSASPTLTRPPAVAQTPPRSSSATRPPSVTPRAASPLATSTAAQKYGRATSPVTSRSGTPTRDRFAAPTASSRTTSPMPSRDSSPVASKTSSPLRKSTLTSSTPASPAPRVSRIGASSPSTATPRSGAPPRAGSAESSAVAKKVPMTTSAPSPSRLSSPVSQRHVPPTAGVRSMVDRRGSSGIFRTDVKTSHDAQRSLNGSRVASPTSARAPSPRLVSAGGGDAVLIARKRAIEAPGTRKTSTGRTASPLSTVSNINTSMTKPAGGVRPPSPTPALNIRGGAPTNAAANSTARARSPTMRSALSGSGAQIGSGTTTPVSRAVRGKSPSSFAQRTSNDISAALSWKGA